MTTSGHLPSPSGPSSRCIPSLVAQFIMELPRTNIMALLVPCPLPRSDGRLDQATKMAPARPDPLWHTCHCVKSPQHQNLGSWPQDVGRFSSSGMGSGTCGHGIQASTDS
eukprot:jgi/Ulvmu1/7623/UM038_0049.1